MLVAWRCSASGSSPGGMPLPSSSTDHRAHAAGQQPHRDLRGAGVERVVDQLAHHRGRALDHLAGGDLADQLAGQFADRAARRGGARVMRAIHGGTAVRGALAAWGASGRVAPDNAARRWKSVWKPSLIDFVLHVDRTSPRSSGLWGLGLRAAVRDRLRRDRRGRDAVPAGRLAAVRGRRAGRRGPDEPAARDGAAAGRGGAGRPGQLHHRPRRRARGCSSGSRSAASTSAAFEQAHAFYEHYGGITHRGGALHAVHPHLRAVRGRRRGDDARKFTLYNVVGGVLWVVGIVTRRATCSATSRASRRNWTRSSGR